jgi:hypothetical protein
VERSQSSTSGDPKSANGPLDNNRPGDRELSGEQHDSDDRSRSSAASQVGRAETGGAESVLDPDEPVREGWPMPDQSDAPSDWPEPTID